MRLSRIISGSIALVPGLLAAMRVFELLGEIKYAIRFFSIATLEFTPLAKRVFELLNTHEADLLFTIYQKTYERSIRFVPVISFLAISMVALYALAPLVVLLLLLPVARYAANIAYVSRVPFFSDRLRAFVEFIKTFVALAIIIVFVPLMSSDVRGRFMPIITLSLWMLKFSAAILHDAFVTYSPLATLIAALIALLARLARQNMKQAIALVSGAVAYFYFAPEKLFGLSLTLFVFLVALYERSSMNVGHSLYVPNVGSLSWIVPLGFTIVMTFVGGTIERYINATLIPAGFISLLTFLSLALGLTLMRYLLRLPQISGIRLGEVRI